MTTQVPVLPPDADQAAVNAALEASGAVILEAFLDAQVLAAFNAELDGIFAAEAGRRRGFANDAIAEFFGDKVGHVAGLAGKSPMFVQHVLCHPRYMECCEHFLKPRCSDYQLNIAHVMERGPGCEAQLIHRDAWVWRRMPPDMGEIQLASLIALTDFSADNGGTLIVPGSHRWGDDRYPEPDEALATEMPAGSAVIYLGNTFHAGGANTTADQVRRGIHVSYTLGWLRTEENQCLATPPDIARALPRRAQQLLGFGIHDDIELGGGYLGTVELEPPYAALAGQGATGD
ncbi:MAG: phytanoyl-CoA dioxygenase family protein [Halioglobus sp.]|nr:phytanoyl-CoA dioxygenase family protein [Halioglobus sp.]